MTLKDFLIYLLENNDNLNKTLNKNKTYNIISFYENDQKTIELLSIIFKLSSIS